MSPGIRLPAAVAVACFGVLAAICVMSKLVTSTSSDLRYGEAILAANDSLLHAAFNADYPGAPKPTRITLARVRRTRQNTVPSQAVFAGAVTSCANCRTLNRSAISEVKAFRPVLTLARLWRRGPPALLLA